jgi:polar amino acid transport system substrate-binding protein
MKKLLTALIVAISCLFMFSFTASAQDSVTISTGEWAPWSGKDLPHNGFVLHVVKEAFKNAGYNVQYKFYPWKRAYSMVASGKVQASAYWYESDKRKQDCYYSDKLTEEKIVFFYKKTNPMSDWKSLEDLQDYKIGASRGVTYTDKFWKLAEQGVLDLDVANDDLTNFKKLVKGRIDIFPSAQVMGYKLLRDNFSPEVVETIETNPKPLATTTGHLLLPKNRDDAQELLKAFNQGLQELKDSGRYDKLLDDVLAGKYSN